jgi:hypothetical protein
MVALVRRRIIMVRKLFLLFSGLLFMAFIGELCDLAAAGDALALAERGSTQLSSPALGPDTTAVWSGGALVVVQGRFSGSPTFSTFDREGGLISKQTFTIPEGRVHAVFDHDFARGVDGSLAIVGLGYTADSRGTTFLARVSPDGTNQTIVRLSPFVPRAVTVAVDGTIWVAGFERTEEGQEPDLSQDVIRSYDKTGKLIGSYVPWSSLQVDFHNRPAEDSILVSSKDRVAWYSPFAHTYMEFSLDGTVLGRFRTDDRPRNVLLSIALCDDGGLFLEAPVYNDRGRQQAGFTIFALERARGEWSSFARPDAKWGTLYGCDGTRIASEAGPSTITWLVSSGKTTP